MTRSVALLRLVALAACSLTVAACASTRETPAPKMADGPRARAETLDVVRRSLVQRVLREAPALTRSGVARLVTMVPLDEGKRARLAPALASMLSSEQLENQAALLLEKSLSADEIHALGEAEARPDVAAVITAATTGEPEGADLEHFVEDPRALPVDRHRTVKALVDVSWSPQAIDRLTRAPVLAAAAIVAAALPEHSEQKDELAHIADSARPTDPGALTVAFAFLWRSVDDASLEGARAYFASPEGAHTTAALVDATVGALDSLASTIEARVR